METFKTEDLKFFEMLKQRRDEMKEKYNRVLPTGELLFNRFDKAEYLKAGEGSSIYDTSIIMGDVKIGKNVWIGPYTLLEGINGKLTIGDFVSINTGVSIFTHDSSKHYLSGGKADFLKGDVSIGNCTVVGSASIINHSVSIGNHCLIGVNSFVKNDIPDNSIAMGSPTKIVGKVIVEDDDVRYEWFKK